MKFLAILISCMLFAPSIAYSAIYKCTNSSGKTVYQESPCKGAGSEITIDSPKQSSPSKPKETKDEQATKPGCAGIIIEKFSPYTKNENQCGKISLQLPGFNGIPRDAVEKKIASRFYAILLDNDTRKPHNFRLVGEDQVTPSKNRFIADACFGVSNLKIIEVGCR